jgi:tRNA pseudouridine38-40 synthase
VKEPLDVDRMRTVARAFTGLRDFRSFADARDAPELGVKSTEVLIERVEIVEDGDLLLVVIEGSHFLWKMVRRMVGVLVEIGRGKLEPEAAARYLVEESAAPARATAPPSGLFLARVYYGTDRRDSTVAAITPLPVGDLSNP